MKILQIINSLNAGGAEKLVVDTSIKFVEKGLDVDVLLLNGSQTSLFEKLSKHNSINIISLGDRKNTYKFTNVFRIKSILNRYDFVHVHLFPSLYWTGLAKLLSRSKTPIILTEHNTTNRRRKSPLFKILDRIIYKQFRKLITISDSVDESLRSHLGNHSVEIVKINNGIDLKVMHDAVPYSKEELGYTSSEKLIIQVASFYPQKDQETLIRSMKLLSNDYKLLLVGQGPLEDKLIQLTKDLGLEEQVNFMGVRSDVPRLLKSVDVVVLSSHFEGLSLSSIEGLASGKPFVCTDAPGLTEVAKDAGVLFAAGDINKLEDIIRKLLEDTDYYDTVVTSCLERAELYHIDLMVDSYIDLYNEVGEIVNNK